MSAVTGISGIQLSAAYAAYAPTNSAEVSAIASAYATGSEQVVTSLQYATSESATVAATVTADTAVGYGSRDISAAYVNSDPWALYSSSSPLIKVRMTADGVMRDYSSYPYYLYMVPYGATNQGNVSTTSQLTGASNYGEFSGGMDDFIIAEGTGSAYSQNPYYVDVTFNVTSVPFWGSQPAWWGTVPEERRYVVDDSENARPVFCVAGGWDGSQLFEMRYYTTAEMDFGSVVTVSAVSGINELEIAGAGGGIDSATVSAIASSYAGDVSAAASGAVSVVSSNSAAWMKPSNFSGIDGIVTSVGSGYGFGVSASAFMGVDSAFKSTTGVISGDTPYNPYTAQLPDGISNEVIVSAASIDLGDFVDIHYSRYDGSTVNDYLYVPSRDKIVLASASGVISAMSRNRPFQVDFTAKQPEAIAFQSDLTGAGGIDSATCSAIASAYAESAVSSVSGNYYTTANESGFLTAQAQASWSESASASPSYIQDKPDLVDIVAGPGIVVDNPDGNTLRVSMAADYETVLWNGSANQSGPFTLNEAYTNFQYVQIKYQNDSSNTPLNAGITKFPTDASQMKIVMPVGDEEPYYKVRLMTLTFSGTSATVKNNSVARYLWNTGGSCSVSTAAAQAPYITEIIGIRRIANN